MSAKDELRCNKIAIQAILKGNYTLILQKIYEKKMITEWEYDDLKCINKAGINEHVVELMDKIMNKGETTCKKFLNLLQTDGDITSTFPALQELLGIPDSVPLSETDERYQLNSQPVGLCVIINNEKFIGGDVRCGTNKDAESLAKVFSWLGFTVLMCKDQTQEQMDQALKYFPLKHGDAFICCILSHGNKGVVFGTDQKPLSIKEITRTFKATDTSALTNKPKVFVIQACQGEKMQRGVLPKDLKTDACPLSVPEEADVLVALATVEDHPAYRHETNGSWFIKSVCQQLKEGCKCGDNITDILTKVNNEVGQEEGCSRRPGSVKQMPEVRYTLTKKLVLSPPSN
uniref:Caspase-8 n=1 Tax=Monopterus albus TaxID=43700 RepID=A0A3Q3INW8_MONAL